MGKKAKLDQQDGQEAYETFKYPEIEETGSEFSEMQRKSSLATDIDDEAEKMKVEEEQKEILDLREVIKNAAKENAEELTQNIQKMLTIAKDVMEKNNTELTNKSVEALKEEMLGCFRDITEPINQVNTTLVNENKQEEMQALREEMIENIAGLELFMKETSKRIDSMENKTKDLIKNIVEKIIGIEISQQSEKIIMTNISLLFEQYRDAQEVQIFLNKRDYQIIKERVELYIEQREMEVEKIAFKQSDSVKEGSFLILTDKGNFDNNIEERMKLIIESIL